ncbi:MAG: hypothetical protein QG654_208 [Patescibacteria group bacterium]|nr:hypothetical protein [Patescibacteria group bacterium]
MNYFFKNIILSTLVFSAISFSVFPSGVSAQVVGGGGNAQGGFNIQGVGAVAASCVDLPGLITDGINAIGSALGFGGDITDPTSAVGAATDAMSVPTKDSVARINTKNTRDEVNANNKKEQCLDAIARYAVLKVIDKITLMTVEWINSGFQGNPFYPEDRPNFFEQIAKDEVTSFTGWFSANPEDYPFGQIISETILLSVQNRLQDNLKFSLNQVLQHNNQYASYSNFQAKFSIGGWAGYTAFAKPNNNVFGNYLMANNHLSRQTAGTNINITKNFQAELNEGSGFLNQRECAKTALDTSNYTSGDDYIDPTNELYLGNYPLIPQGQTMTQSIYEGLPQAVRDYLDGQNGTDAQALEYNFIVQRSTCLQWKTVTPGGLLAAQTTQVLGSPLRNLELGDELNENLGLIFDALANQLFQSVAGGVRSLYRTDGQYSSNPADPNYNAVWAQNNNSNFGSNSQQTPVSTAINGSVTDPGIVAIQQNYMLRAGSAIQSLATLVRDIQTLDYCVPGPNPNWYESGSQSLQNVVSTVLPGQTPAYYGDRVQDFTGVNVPDSAVPNYEQFISFINFVLTRYRDAVFAEYPLLGNPPAVRPVATNLYLQIESFTTRIETLQSQINGLMSVMPQLQLIQSQLAALTPAQQADTSSPEMQTISSLLAQVSNQGVLVNQGQLDQLNQDIVNYESQIFAVDNYIGQCIQEVTNNNYSGLNERVTYPYPSISQNPSFGQIPTPNTNYFLNSSSFGDDAGQIDLSDFNGQNLTIPTVNTETFVDHLLSLF